MSSYDKKYISIGCNRSSNAADINDDGVVAFGGGNYVCIWNPNDVQSRGVSHTLEGHSGDVRIVKYLQSNKQTNDFVSGCTAGKIIIWNKEYGQDAIIDAHSKSISAIGTLRAPVVERAGHLIVSAGSDSLLKVWNIVDKKAEELQCIDLAGRFVLDATLSVLPHSNTPIMALSLTNNRIEVWTLVNNSFVKALSLEGHEDWVRALSFATFPSENGDNLILASGSQDGYIRLWNISTHLDNMPKSEVNVDKSTLNSALLDDFERKIQESDATTSSLSTKSHVFTDQDTLKQ